MLAVVESATLFGIDALPIKVEINVATGVPVFTIVGLPDAAVQESRERVRAAIRNSNLRFPSDRATVVNLAPADVRKAGPAFDLPIAMAVLAATEQVPIHGLAGCLLIGELGLDGSVRAVPGSLSVAMAVRRRDDLTLIVPWDNYAEAALVDGIKVIPVKTLLDAVQVIRGDPYEIPPRPDPEELLSRALLSHVDYADVKGNLAAKRALEIAAAGGHNLLMVGPPGSGKTMLARRMPGILPPMSVEEALDVTRIHSISSITAGGTRLMVHRPFRSPHHTVSHAGLTGGGSIPRPGEVSLAHRGVLFLDELPEFHRDVLEVMRQPLEDGQVTIARAAATLTYPARCSLIAAMNPCPCGYYGDRLRPCTCTRSTVEAYLRRLSGPLLDRIDIHMEVPRIPHTDLMKSAPGEGSAEIRARVVAARNRQHARCVSLGWEPRANSLLMPKEMGSACPLTPACKELLGNAVQRLNLSARAHDRILKVALTIADLAREDSISESHIAEAVQYRSMDRRLFG
jgi:magnesium chelatase family protein